MRRTTERWSSFSVSLVLVGLSVATAPLLGLVASTRPDTAMILGIAAATFLILGLRSLLLGHDTTRPGGRWRRSMGAALVLAGMFQVAAVRVASPPFQHSRCVKAGARVQAEPARRIKPIHLACPYGRAGL